MNPAHRVHGAPKWFGWVATILAAPAALAAEFAEGHTFLFGFDFTQGSFALAELTETGSIVRRFGHEYHLANATALAFLPDGSLAVVTGANGLVAEFAASGELVATRPLGTNSSAGATIDDRGRLYFAAPEDDILVAVMDGSISSKDISALGGDEPNDVELDPFGRILFTSRDTNRIHRFSEHAAAAPEILGDDASCSEVTRLAVTPAGDIFAIRDDSDDLVYISESGTTVMTKTLDGNDPIDITIAPDGSVAVLFTSPDEIVYVDPATLDVKRRVAMPGDFSPRCLAYAPARFAMSMKGIVVEDDAPSKIGIPLVTASFDRGAGRFALSFPSGYGGPLSAVLQSPYCYRLQYGHAAGSDVPTAGFGATTSTRSSVSLTIESSDSESDLPLTKKLVGSFDAFDSEQGHFSIKTTKKLK